MIHLDLKDHVTNSETSPFRASSVLLINLTMPSNKLRPIKGTHAKTMHFIMVYMTLICVIHLPSVAHSQSTAIADSTETPNNRTSPLLDYACDCSDSRAIKSSCQERCKTHHHTNKTVTTAATATIGNESNSFDEEDYHSVQRRSLSVSEANIQRKTLSLSSTTMASRLAGANDVDDEYFIEQSHLLGVADRHDDDVTNETACTAGDCGAYENDTICVGDVIYCNLTYEEYHELLYDYIFPSVSEWVLIISHIIVFVVGLVSITWNM